MRIGEVAEAVGTTSRTIRYYEEIGLLGSAADRASGQHRTYTEQDVERLRDALRLKDLLGLSLEELREIYLQLQLTSVVALDELAAAGRGSPSLVDTLKDEAAPDPVALSLEELRELMEAEDASTARRDEWHHGQPGPARRAAILKEAERHIERQLELVARRRAEVQELESELKARQERVRALLREISQPV